jgi:hypothetical protein
MLLVLVIYISVYTVSAVVHAVHNPLCYTVNAALYTSFQYSALALTHSCAIVVYPYVKVLRYYNMQNTEWICLLYWIYLLVGYA